MDRATIIPINAPGAGTSAGLGTQAPGINSAGAVTGIYSDSKNVMHGFVRYPDGQLMTFEAPDAGNRTVVPGFWGTAVPGVMGGQGTYSVTINPGGTIAGFYADHHSVSHGFVWAPDGKFTSFEAPPEYVGTGEGQGTGAGNINPAGWIAGWSVDGYGASHGLVRDPDGNITMFDVTGAGTLQGSFQGTYPWSINTAGATTGEYFDANGMGHGFVRAPDGTIADINVLTAVQGTIAYGINDAGVIVGSGQGTIPLTNNDAGAITGAYIDGGGVLHGFLLFPEF